MDAGMPNITKNLLMSAFLDSSLLLAVFKCLCVFISFIIFLKITCQRDYFHFMEFVDVHNLTLLKFCFTLFVTFRLLLQYTKVFFCSVNRFFSRHVFWVHMTLQI